MGKEKKLTSKVEISKVKNSSSKFELLFEAF